MSNSDRSLGTCPSCGSPIRRLDELISYERSDNTVGTFAECPACGEVVSPE